MRSFITRIRLPLGKPADQSFLHKILSSDPLLSAELISQHQQPGALELEYRTSGLHSISELGRTIAGAVDSVQKSSSFFIIREKKS